MTLSDELEKLARITKLRIDRKYHAVCLELAFENVLDGKLSDEYAKLALTHSEALKAIDSQLSLLGVSEKDS